MRVGTVCYATRQGIGWIPKRYYDAGVITDVVILHHHARHNYIGWYPAGTPVVASRPFDRHDCIHEMLRAVDVVLFVETPFDWAMLALCRKYGVKSVIIPMYECTPRHLPDKPDMWMNPSLLDQDIFGGPFVPVPVPDVYRERWSLKSRARRFLHNGGHLGLRGHKGTLELLKAMRYVTSPIELRVTSQDVPGLQQIIHQVPDSQADSRITFSTEDIPHEELYDGYDVFIMAEKYNGLSLPLAEARATGMVVVTSNRYPINTWLPNEHLFPVDKYQKACVSGAYREYDEAIIEPEYIAGTIDKLYDQDIESYSHYNRTWAELNSWRVLKPQILEALSS